MPPARLADTLEERCRSRLVQIDPVEAIERVAVDREGVRPAVNHAAHAVFVWPPRGEPRQILEDAFPVGVEDVRSIPVHQQAVFVQFVVGIAPDVRPLVDDVNAVAGLGQFARHHAAD